MMPASRLPGSRIAFFLLLAGQIYSDNGILLYVFMLRRFGKYRAFLKDEIKRKQKLSPALIRLTKNSIFVDT